MLLQLETNYLIGKKIRGSNTGELQNDHMQARRKEKEQCLRTPESGLVL